MGVLVFLLFFNFAKASEPDVVINEVAWMGTTISSYNEWIELKNLSDKDINLDGWTLETGDYKVEIDDEGIEIKNEKDRINLKGEIKSGDFFLLKRKYKEEKGDLTYSSKFNLSNSDGEVLILRDEEGEKIDEVDVDDKGGWLAGDSNFDRTMERTEDGGWQNSGEPNGTPREKNSAKEDAEDEDNENKDEDNKEKCILENRVGLDKVYLNELLPDPSSDDLAKKKEEERIELYNSGDKEVDIGGCCLVDGRYDPEENNSAKKCFFIKKNEKISSGEYKFFKRAELIFDMNKNNETIFLLDENGKELDKIYYKSSEVDLSFALDFKGNWQWVDPTFGAINVFPIPKIYSKKIEITELMPNADGSDKDNEWVELFNGDVEKIELADWYLFNQSNQKFELDELEIKSNKRLKIEIKNSSFSLRNSDGRVDLVDPNGEVADTVSYIESAKEESSYNKNSKGEWSWSIFITPGAVNKFNNPPTYRVDIPDEIYEDVKVELKIKKVEDKDGEDLKYRWDFGDDHKSYLQETTHTFTKKKEYTIQTRVSDLSTDVFKDFEITVKKFPELDLRIVKLLPNPSGADSNNEKIWIENQEKKTVNLKGWIVATGKDSKSLVNHYVKADFKIKAGKIKSLNRDDCPFSLLNKKGRVVLKSPNGEIVDKIKYEKENLSTGEVGIAEDELYYLKDDVWVWETPIEVENPKVLGEIDSNKLEIVPEKRSLITLNQIMENSRLKRTDSLKVLFFENWLFIQSQGYFFEFLFPLSYQERFKS